MIKTVERDELVAVVGDIGDLKIAAIEETGATLEQLERAVKWWKGESDVMGEARDRLSGVEAEIYEILVSEDEDEEARPR